MIEEADKGLVEPITDYNALVTCMSHLTKIREKQAKTDTMFGPLAETVEMLKSYKVEISDDIYDQLEVCNRNCLLFYREIMALDTCTSLKCRL